MLITTDPSKQTESQEIYSSIDRAKTFPHIEIINSNRTSIRLSILEDDPLNMKTSAMRNLII